MLLRPLCGIAALTFALAAVPAAVAAPEWDVIKRSGWDYLTVDNIARFYGFPETLEPIEKTVRLDNGAQQLEFTLGSREAIINGVRTWLCFPVVEHSDGKYLVSRIDLSKTIEPQLRPHLVRNLGRLKTVVLDAGHGGVEKGASSSHGLEKEYTLDVAKRLKPLLEERGFNVVMTRTSDELVPLPERARIANATRDSIFVSIHFNATDHNRAASGLEIYSLTPRGAPSTNDNTVKARFAAAQPGTPVDTASLALSMAVYHSMVGHMPEFDRGIKRARFAVLRLTKIPAILVEGGFLSERQEARMIADPQWRARLAYALAVGIENYRALAEKRQRPMLLADYRRRYEGELIARNASEPVDADSAVVPASNVKPLAPSARVTEPVRDEPSPQFDVKDGAIYASASGSGADAHSGEGELDEPESGPPPMTPELAAGQPPVPAPESAGSPQEMPGVEEVLSTEVRTDPGVTAAELSAPPPHTAAAATRADAAAASPPVRKYRVLKFDPPPKFRQ